ncbi:MAG: polysaccharide export protein [Tannerellaceae bacterium]|jgi:polysaccharide export outer membrane protein|nr:polysaccharide export protein [Tannerellaceae bacterium]
MNVKLLLLSFLLLILSGACSTPKDIAYFQGIDTLSVEQLNRMHQAYSSQICLDDMLTITVTAWDPSVVTPFNPPVYAVATPGESLMQQSTQLHTYLVDSDGNINFPVLGKVRAAGLSKQELVNKLQREISNYVEDAMVSVQIVNYKVTVLGEVLTPGTIEVKNDRISILDALGQAGDLTINADRKNLLIVRDNNGRLEYAHVDLTNPDLFASPFYYLRQNDVIYVEPNKAKKKNSRYSQAEQYNITVFSTVLSAISLITSLVITLKR